MQPYDDARQVVFEPIVIEPTDDWPLLPTMIERNVRLKTYSKATPRVTDKSTPTGQENRVPSNLKRPAPGITSLSKPSPKKNRKASVCDKRKVHLPVTRQKAVLSIALANYICNTSVLGSVHQGHPKFGRFRAQQCTGISMRFITLMFQLASQWASLKIDSHKIDEILREGTILYRNALAILNRDQSDFRSRNGFLSIDEWPRIFSIGDEHFRFTILTSVYGLVSMETTEVPYYTLYDGLVEAFSHSKYLCFTCEEYTMSIYMAARTKILWFDSHDRSDVGCVSTTGSAVLLTFTGVQQLHTFIQVLVGQYSRLHQGNSHFALGSFVISAIDITRGHVSLPTNTDVSSGPDISGSGVPVKQRIPATSAEDKRQPSKKRNIESQ